MGVGDGNGNDGALLVSKVMEKFRQENRRKPEPWELDVETRALAKLVRKRADNVDAPKSYYQLTRCALGDADYGQSDNVSIFAGELEAACAAVALLDTLGDKEPGAPTRDDLVDRQVMEYFADFVVRNEPPNQSAAEDHFDISRRQLRRRFELRGDRVMGRLRKEFPHIFATKKPSPRIWGGRVETENPVAFAGI